MDDLREGPGRDRGVATGPDVFRSGASSRVLDPRKALDYPRLADDQVIIWTGNGHLWPDARRETYYLGHCRDRLRGHALFTMHPERAMTFPDRKAAQAFLDEMNARRPAPYHDVHVATVAELKLLRGYADPEIDVGPSP